MTPLSLSSLELNSNASNSSVAQVHDGSSSSSLSVSVSVSPCSSVECALKNTLDMSVLLHDFVASTQLQIEQIAQVVSAEKRKADIAGAEVKELLSKQNASSTTSSNDSNSSSAEEHPASFLNIGPLCGLHYAAMQNCGANDIVSGRTAASGNSAQAREIARLKAALEKSEKEKTLLRKELEWKSKLFQGQQLHQQFASQLVHKIKCFQNLANHQSQLLCEQNRRMSEKLAVTMIKQKQLQNSVLALKAQNVILIKQAEEMAADMQRTVHQWKDDIQEKAHLKLQVERAQARQHKNKQKALEDLKLQTVQPAANNSDSNPNCLDSAALSSASTSDMHIVEQHQNLCVAADESVSAVGLVSGVHGAVNGSASGSDSDSNSSDASGSEEEDEEDFIVNVDDNDNGLEEFVGSPQEENDSDRQAQFQVEQLH